MNPFLGTRLPRPVKTPNARKNMTTRTQPGTWGLPHCTQAPIMAYLSALLLPFSMIVRDESSLTIERKGKRSDTNKGRPWRCTPWANHPNRRSVNSESRDPRAPASWSIQARRHPAWVQKNIREDCSSADHGATQGELPGWPGQERTWTTAEQALFCRMLCTSRGLRSPQWVSNDWMRGRHLASLERAWDDKAGSFGAGLSAWVE